MALPAFAKGRNFNPRSREGSDGKLPDLRRVYDISIRAPARGATGRDALITGVRTISIRAPARGATEHVS